MELRGNHYLMLLGVEAFSPNPPPSKFSFALVFLLYQ